MNAANVTTVAILGFGTMGQGLAKLLVDKGTDVVITDIDSVGARDRIRLNFESQRQAHTGKASFAATAVDAAEEADLVIEALPEILDLKVQVLREILAHHPDIPVYSNTSSIPIDAMSAALDHPSALLGVHFFNPPEIIPGVEVIPGEYTDPQVVSDALAFLGGLGKKGIVIKSSPGFIANRLQLALFAEAARCLEEGLASAEDIDKIVVSTFGLRLANYGPFAIADMAGLDIFHAIQTMLATSYGDRFAVGSELNDRIASKRLGLKSGSGFYEYKVGEAAGIAFTRDRKYSRTIQATEAIEEYPQRHPG
jgi:3-hydroxybutyryl-CoA dehydrogenase